MVPTLSLLLPLGAYGLLTSLGVAGSKAGEWYLRFLSFDILQSAAPE